MSDAVGITCAALAAAAGVTALVSTRVYPDFIPQGAARPCIRAYLVSEMNQGGLAQDYAPHIARVSVEILGDTSGSVHAVAEAVKTTFLAFRNQIVLTKTVSVWKQGSDASFFEDLNQVKTFRRVSDYMVGWK